MPKEQEERQDGTLVEAATKGDSLKMLELLRLGIARQLEDTSSGRDMAALSKQFMDITREIDELKKFKPSERRTALDVAKQKKAKRRANAKNKDKS